jgi:hypothetical protein
MIALTDLVFPGFFRPRTLEMGSYLGIYDGRRLAAMAGERMRLDGYQELSAVCTHPDYTGRGYAQRPLGIPRRSTALHAVLHVCADNERAIGVPQDELRRPDGAAILAFPMIISTERLALHESRRATPTRAAPRE